MKRFRISFLAIIALLAVGLTAATNAEVLESKKVAPPVSCYQSLTALDAACLDVPLLINSTACAIAQPPVDGIRVVGTLNTSIDCNEVDDKFCCAQLTVDPNPCTSNQAPVTFIDIADGQSKTAFAKIQRVYCKSEE